MFGNGKYVIKKHFCIFSKLKKNKIVYVFGITIYSHFTTLWLNETCNFLSDFNWTADVRNSTHYFILSSLIPRSNKQCICQGKSIQEPRRQLLYYENQIRACVKVLPSVGIHGQKICLLCIFKILVTVFNLVY